MNLLLFGLIVAIVLPQISTGLSFNIHENEELCTSEMKELSICKLRTMLDQAVREMEEIIMSYKELTGFYGKLNAQASTENRMTNPVNGAKDKRKSAFVRFGKRSNPETADSLNLSSPGSMHSPVPEQQSSAEISKRKSSYVRFGKREQ